MSCLLSAGCNEYLCIRWSTKGNISQTQWWVNCQRQVIAIRQGNIYITLMLQDLPEAPKSYISDWKRWHLIQVSAATDRPKRRSASCPLCCTQMSMVSVINCDQRRLPVYYANHPPKLTATEMISRSRDMVGAHQNLNGSRDRDLTTLHSGIICHQWASTFNLAGLVNRDRTNQPLLFQDRISNCTNLFRPEPNWMNHTCRSTLAATDHTRRRPPWRSRRRVARRHGDN